MKELIVSTAHDTGNLIVKELPGDVICEMAPIPDAEKYARLFAVAENMYQIIISPTVRIALQEGRERALLLGRERLEGGKDITTQRAIYAEILEMEDKIREIHEYVTTKQFQNNDRG